MKQLEGARDESSGSTRRGHGRTGIPASARSRCFPIRVVLKWYQLEYLLFSGEVLDLLRGLPCCTAKCAQPVNPEGKGVADGERTAE